MSMSSKPHPHAQHHAEFCTIKKC